MKDMYHKVIYAVMAATLVTALVLSIISFIRTTKIPDLHKTGATLHKTESGLLREEIPRHKHQEGSRANPDVYFDVTYNKTFDTVPSVHLRQAVNRFSNKHVKVFFDTEGEGTTGFHGHVNDESDVLGNAVVGSNAVDVKATDRVLDMNVFTVDGEDRPAVIYSNNAKLYYVLAKDSKGLTWDHYNRVECSASADGYTAKTAAKLLNINNNPVVIWINSGNIQFFVGNGATGVKLYFSKFTSGVTLTVNHLDAMVVDDNRILIAYFDDSNNDVKCIYTAASLSSPFTSQTPVTVQSKDLGSTGAFVDSDYARGLFSMAFVNDLPAIVYSTGNDLFYKQSNSRIGATWTNAEVEIMDGTTGGRVVVNNATLLGDPLTKPIIVYEVVQNSTNRTYLQVGNSETAGFTSGFNAEFDQSRFVANTHVKTGETYTPLSLRPTAAVTSWNGDNYVLLCYSTGSADEYKSRSVYHPLKETDLKPVYNLDNAYLFPSNSTWGSVIVKNYRHRSFVGEPTAALTEAASEPRFFSPATHKFDALGQETNEDLGPFVDNVIQIEWEAREQVDYDEDKHTRY